MRQRQDSFDRGFGNVQMGQLIAPASSVALGLTITAQRILIRALNGNTDTVWMGTASNTTSLTGYPVQSLTTIDLPLQAGSLTLFFQSQGASSGIAYIALGF